MIEKNRWPIEVLVVIFKWFSIEEQLKQLARWRMKLAMEPESEQAGAMPDCSPQKFPAIDKVLSIFLTTPSQPYAVSSYGLHHQWQKID